VTENIPNNELWKGIPAKFFKKINNGIEKKKIS
jgi:hypothetical protein